MKKIFAIILMSLASLAVLSCGYNRTFEPSNPDGFYPHSEEDYYQKVDTLYKNLSN